MIELFIDKNNCCGCTACMSICPNSAITMDTDKEGFKYPIIDAEKCIECNLCKDVCSFQNGYDISMNLSEPLVYAVKNNDESIRMSSTSGGAFTAISDYIIENHGVIYGVAFDDDFNVVHQRAENQEQRDKFKGSKYVQSELGDIFLQINQDLKENKDVLFTGTPCQCSGLKTYLNATNIITEKLVLCDIVCHGTPSPLLWRDHIESCEKKANSKLKEYYCRSKILGWHGHNEMVVYENGKSDYRSLTSQKHKNVFYSHNGLRPSCHNCKYTNLERCSDITMADFWGIEKSMPDFDDNKGVSLLLINTYKGSEIFNKIKYKVAYKKSNTRDCLQPQLQYPAKASPKREKFWMDYYNKGYSFVVKRHTQLSIKNQIKIKVSLVLKKLKILNFFKKIYKIYK